MVEWVLTCMLFPQAPPSLWYHRDSILTDLFAALWKGFEKCKVGHTFSQPQLTFLSACCAQAHGQKQRQVLPEGSQAQGSVTGLPKALRGDGSAAVPAPPTPVQK